PSAARPTPPRIQVATGTPRACAAGAAAASGVVAGGAGAGPRTTRRGPPPPARSQPPPLPAPPGSAGTTSPPGFHRTAPAPGPAGATVDRHAGVRDVRSGSVLRADDDARDPVVELAEPPGAVRAHDGGTRVARAQDHPVARGEEVALLAKRLALRGRVDAGVH